MEVYWSRSIWDIDRSESIQFNWTSIDLSSNKLKRAHFFSFRLLKLNPSFPCLLTSQPNWALVKAKIDFARNVSLPAILKKNLFMKKLSSKKKKRSCLLSIIVGESSKSGEGGLGNLLRSRTFSLLISGYLTITSTPLIHNGNFRLFDVNLRLGGWRAVICDQGWFLYSGVGRGYLHWKLSWGGDKVPRLFFTLSYRFINLISNSGHSGSENGKNSVRGLNKVISTKFSSNWKIVKTV